MDAQIEKAIALLKQQSHTVKEQNREGTFWFDIDGRMLLSVQQMHELADSKYSIEDLEALFKEEKRAASSGSGS